MSKFEINEEIIRSLAGLLDETGLSEIEYESQGHRLRVSKGAVAQSVVAAPAPAAVAAAESAPAAVAADQPLAGAVNSPMVGTAYMAPEPSAPAFIKVGDMVTEGQTLLIIEAMKVMNELKSPRSGKVTNIMVSDGQPVEFGEPLLTIE
ncbi:acetyl-CoA carboxylase biotin carboxyl carrier protein [Denitrobaculum tricleocarpae]|uniref:Biotin carboxyl carrier protein of acetyl-CoA carboxylase n=1 Tax=Denitrobaculum tricleocarpae TaxID=2591009 RepID=A0A545TAQ9_9PROT|nr:acetyl-CoA carboxylase biotin carboxyl carrier protein [Denitrobaculum tricleocarpae]TQV74301.1 acetyl-CoA carboxylase biotin carboxyl carrier protein [Denitrobaculum tricleocarpae]